MLDEFWTSINWRRGRRIDRLLPARLRRQLERRSFPEFPGVTIRTSPWRELGRFVAPAIGLPWLTRHERGPFSVDAIYQSFDRAVARRVLAAKGIIAVYTGEDCAHATFRAAEQRGFHRFYDLPIGYWRAAQALFAEEIECEPEWASTIPGASDSAEKLARKDEELRLATAIMVPSGFVKKTLRLAPEIRAPIHVNPFGAPLAITSREPQDQTKKLGVLFVGALSQRKGLSYLLEAIRLMKSGVDLTLIGRKASESCEPLNDAVKKHRWIRSLPHAEVLNEMGRHDVLVFPTLFEGFALVILEGLSQGLPVITTPNSGGLEVVIEGVNGFVVPIRSPLAIAEKLEVLATDRGRLREMRDAAKATAARFTWEAYRARLVETVRAVIGSQPIAYRTCRPKR